MIEELEFKFLHYTELCGYSDDQAYETLAMMYGVSEEFLRENLLKKKSTGRL